MAHSHYVRATLTGVEQQRERQPGARAHGMAMLELGDFGLGPGMIALALGGRDFAHITGGIISPQPDLYGMLHQRAQGLAQCVRRPGCIGSGSEKLNHMVTLQERDGTITYVSPSTSRLLGYATTDLLGRSLLEAVHANDRTWLERRFARTIWRLGDEAVKAASRTALTTIG